MIAPAAAPTFPKRKVWHSDLVKVSPLTIVLTSRPRDSRFSGRLPYCTFQVEGDPQEYELQVEGTAVRFTLEKGVGLNQPTRVAAAGRGEHAVIELLDAAPSPHAARAELVRRAAETPGAPGNPEGGESIARDLFRALEAAHAIVGTFAERYGREPSDAELRVAASLFIESQRSGRPISGGVR